MKTFSFKQHFSYALLIGIAFITLSAIPLSVLATTHAAYSIPGFLPLDPRSILVPSASIVTEITGKLGGASVGAQTNFTAIKINSSVFLAQMTISKNTKKGVFLKINYQDQTIRPMVGRYCVDCPNRNLNLKDRNMPLVTSQGSDGYGVLDLSILTAPSATVSPFGLATVSGSVTKHSAPISNFTNGGMTTEITGKLGGASFGTPTNFIAIKLSDNSFLAQANMGIYKKGVFFKINDDDSIKATQARYCLLSECQNRNLTLTDNSGYVATSLTAGGYGIFDLKITFLRNLAFAMPTQQSSTYSNGYAWKANDGSTHGIFLDTSVTHTSENSNYGAWWQVDLGNTKRIQQIRIFNRTDCCKERLTHYQVSIIDNSDSEITTYQRRLNNYPNPKQVIDFGIQNVTGRYVKIQLTSNNILSLAEVQVLGSDM